MSRMQFLASAGVQVDPTPQKPISYKEFFARTGGGPDTKKGLSVNFTESPGIFLAGRQGFEPWLTESESVVLPLDDLPKFVGIPLAHRATSSQ